MVVAMRRGVPKCPLVSYRVGRSGARAHGIARVRAEPVSPHPWLSSSCDGRSCPPGRPCESMGALRVARVRAGQVSPYSWLSSSCDGRRRPPVTWRCEPYGCASRCTCTCRAGCTYLSLSSSCDGRRGPSVSPVSMGDAHGGAWARALYLCMAAPYRCCGTTRFSWWLSELGMGDAHGGA